MKSFTFTGHDKSDVERQISIWRAANPEMTVRKIHSPRYMPVSNAADRIDSSKSKQLRTRVLIRVDYDS
jgi:hypothetical protein